MGDVGYFREGRFIPLFNVVKSADDPVNRSSSEAPRGFEGFSEFQPKLPIHQYQRACQSFQLTGMEIEGKFFSCAVFLSVGDSRSSDRSRVSIQLPWSSRLGLGMPRRRMEVQERGRPWGVTVLTRRFPHDHRREPLEPVDQEVYAREHGCLAGVRQHHVGAQP